MDYLKAKVLDAVTKAVNEHFESAFNDGLVDDDLYHPFTIEVHDTSPSENTLRVASATGFPRYFRVKVSEIL